MPPAFTFRDSLDEPPHITLGRKAWKWYTNKYRETGIWERDLWQSIISDIGPGRKNNNVSRKARKEGNYHITYPPDSEGYELLQEHISFRYDEWFASDERYKIPIIVAQEPESLDVQVRKGISNILKGKSWTTDNDNNNDLSARLKKVTLDRCTDAEHFIRTALYPAWKSICGDLHNNDTANIYCFDLPYNHTNLAFDIIDAMASYQQCPQINFRLVLDSAKYTDDQMVELLTTERPLSSNNNNNNKELTVEITDGSTEARTSLIHQIDDSALIIDATSNSCILQAIRDPAIHLSLTGDKYAPRPWGILKFIVNWEERGFYERCIEATRKIPGGRARISGGCSPNKGKSRATTTKSYREIRPKPTGGNLPLRSKSASGSMSPVSEDMDIDDNTTTKTTKTADKDIDNDPTFSPLHDDDRYRLLQSLWLERNTPLDEVVRENMPEFEFDPSFGLPDDARLDLMEALLDEKWSTTWEILEDFYDGGHFIYNELDQESRWREVRMKMQGLHRRRAAGGGLKGGATTFARHRQASAADADVDLLKEGWGPLRWEDPELIHGEILGWEEPLKKGGVVLENHFERRFQEMFIDLVYEVRYRWLNPGFGQIFNPTFYFCRQGIMTGSRNHLATALPRIDRGLGLSLDDEKVHHYDFNKAAEERKAASTSTDSEGNVPFTPSVYEGRDRLLKARKAGKLPSSSAILQHRKSVSAPDDLRSKTASFRRKEANLEEEISIFKAAVAAKEDEVANQKRRERAPSPEGKQ
ncbi:hypothetical protein B0T20DRAFT_364640 [Sordaria brevicollis]|uniref:Uncharacterized protein n=1 Tax=Sordaria brevicollis TaxID=83679 RepID=A0AAE0NW42_SORBR|nr:hypothetical protein B0T20DRAFT_364640 [Sordaria brevicollis]